jgi:hypothetical protein
MALLLVDASFRGVAMALLLVDASFRGVAMTLLLVDGVATTPRPYSLLEVR